MMATAARFQFIFVLFCFGAIVTLCGYAQTIQSGACENPTIREQTILSDVPPHRSQAGRGFCYAFAARAILQRHYCQSRGGCRYLNGAAPQNDGQFASEPPSQLSKKDPKDWTAEDIAARESLFQDDELSVLDLIRRTRNGALLEGGAGVDTLRSIASEGKLAKESCTSFWSVMLAGVERQRSARGFWEELEDLYEQFQISRKASEWKEQSAGICTHVAKVQAALPFNIQSDFRQIFVALREPSYEAFSAGVLIPEACRNNAVSLPPFTVKTLPNRPIAREELFTKISRLLADNRMPMASHCSRPDPGDENKCYGWHANVITGRRQLCCGASPQNCRWQLKLWDSANPRYDSGALAALPENQLFDNNAPEHGWEDADTFMDKILLNRLRPKWEFHLGWIE